MKYIDINKQEGVRFTLFPDNQPHINLTGDLDLEGQEVTVKVSLLDSQLMLNLLQVSNALDKVFAVKDTLIIPYLMAARYDRVMQPGDSVDLEVISGLINSCGFRKVILHDVHSDVATALIKNSVNVNNQELVRQYNKPNSILICPDAGAVKKVSKYLDWNKNLTDAVYVNKTRDLSNGNLTIKVLEPEKCEGKDCVIVDDLVDAGGTFLGIASQIKPKSLTLIVTHGIFSKGCKMFEGVFDQIITSDSYCRSYDSSVVKVIKL
jgi:ribose-phosphate pyrophosphokinase